MKRSLNRHYLSSAFFALGCLISVEMLGVTVSRGEVLPSPITPSGLHTQVSDPITLPANHIQYDITGGTRPGGLDGTNLFHSFGDFGVPPNNIANFLNGVSFDLNGNLLPAGLPTSNILARVTGNIRSDIFGTIQTTDFLNANLFLINPYGFLFGPNATVNVGGMVTFTSADYLRLTDGVQFNKTPNVTQDALLTTMPVAAYGFLGSNPLLTITVQGSQFALTERTGISLVAGDITIESGTLDDGTTIQPARLTAPSGQISLVSVASPGEVAVATTNGTPTFNVDSFSSLGTVRLLNGAIIDVSTMLDANFNPLSTNGSGNVIIRGGQFMMDNSSITAFNFGSTVDAPTAVEIDIRGDTMMNSSSMFATAIDVAGGNIAVESGSLMLTGSTILTDTAGLGNGGHIAISAAGPLSIVSSFVQAVTDADGTGGSINVTATSPSGSITVSEGGGIQSLAFGAGNGGALAIQAEHSMTIESGGVVSTQGGTSGAAGNITIMAGETVTASGPPDSLHDVIVTIAGFDSASKAGDIFITAKSFVLQNNAKITSDSTSAQAGNITIAASESVNVSSGSRIVAAARDLAGGTIDISSQTITMNGASIRSEAIGVGDAGAIALTGTNSVTITNSEIRTDSYGTRQAGSVTISAQDTLTVAGQFTNEFGNVTPAGVFSQTFGSGDGGNILLSSKSITVSNGAQISSSTFRTGAAGTIELNADDVSINTGAQLRTGSVIAPLIPTGAGGVVTIQGQVGAGARSNTVVIDGPDSGIFTDTQGTGAGGNIFVNANSVTLQNGGTLSAATSGSEATATGGTITVEATQVLLTDRASITAATTALGDAGSVTINAAESIALVDSSYISSNSFDSDSGAGNGGAIWLTSPTIELQGGQLLSQSQGPGNAGNILLEARTVTVGANSAGLESEINAQTLLGSGRGGDITIRGLNGPSSRAGDVTISGASAVTSTTSFGDGRAGDITVRTERMTLTNSLMTTATAGSAGDAGSITIDANESVQVSSLSVIESSSEVGPGNAGHIAIIAPTVIVDQDGVISTSTNGTGNAGGITVNANQVQLNNGGLITASTTGAGAGGSIMIAAGSTFASNASTVSSTTAQAQGGDINITAGQSVTLNNGSLITASSTGPGDAGNILINAGQNYTSTNSAVTTQATALGTEASGGNIKVLATDMVQLTNSQLNASVQGSSTTVGGNITIDPLYVMLQNSQILAQATQGQGGAISITITNGGLFLSDATSTVSASSQFGVNGTITIQSPNAPISGQIQPLGKTPLIATSLLNQHCASLAGGEFSSFTVAGRDSLPTEPGSWLASPLYAAGVGLGIKAEGGKAEGVSASAGQVASGQWLSTGEGLGVSGEWRVGGRQILSLRQIAPAGFLTQAFAVEEPTGCQS